MRDEARLLFLRGVNVGAHRVLPMALLREVLEGLGLTGVRTHIQSGNAVFRGLAGDDDALAARITAALGMRLAFAPLAMVRGRANFAGLLATCPFGAEDPRRVHLGLLAGPPRIGLAELTALAAPGERVALVDGALWLHTPEGLGTSALGGKAESRLSVAMTMRNLRVARTVAALAEEVEAC